MDQITDLYNELVSFDPSLAENKEAVLQVIAKMIAAKPVITVSPQRQQQFSEKLAHYIADKKAVATSSATSGSSLSRFSKWSLSFATLFIVAVVAGSSYWWYTMDSHTPIKNNNPVALYTQTGNTESESGVANDQSSGSIKDIAMANLFHTGNASSQSTNSTGVDTASATRVAVVNPETNPQRTGSTKMAATQNSTFATTNSSGTTGETNAVNPTSAATTTTTAQSSDNIHKKQIAILVIDNKGTIGQTAILPTLGREAVIATFVEGDDQIALKLQNQGYEIRTNLSAIHYTDINTWIENYKTGNTNGENIIAINVEQAMQHTDLLQNLIQELNADGYTFVRVSVIQK